MRPPSASDWPAGKICSVNASPSAAHFALHKVPAVQSRRPLISDANWRCMEELSSRNKGYGSLSGIELQGPLPNRL